MGGAKWLQHVAPNSYTCFWKFWGYNCPVVPLIADLFETKSFGFSLFNNIALRAISPFVQALVRVNCILPPQRAVPAWTKGHGRGAGVVGTASGLGRGGFGQRAGLEGGGGPWRARVWGREEESHKCVWQCQEATRREVGRELPMVLYRPVTRGVKHLPAPPLEKFSPTLEKCVGHSLKNFCPSQKTLRPPGVPNCFFRT